MKKVIKKKKKKKNWSSKFYTKQIKNNKRKRERERERERDKENKIGDSKIQNMWIRLTKIITNI